MYFTHAIVCPPCKNIIYGITTTSLSKPNRSKSLQQHKNYVKFLEELGLDILVLPPDENYPDSTFVEDTAILLPNCAIITQPGAKSRKGETYQNRRGLPINDGDLDSVVFGFPFAVAQRPRR